MNDQNQPTLVMLRIELDPDFGSDRNAKFTLTDDAGADLPAPVTMSTSALESNWDVLSQIAAGTTEPAGGLPFGAPDGTRVIFTFTGHDASGYQMQITVAYPGSGDSYVPVTVDVMASDASFSRLVAGFRQVLDAGQGAYDWVVSD